jgi:hypothetical protein
LPLVETERTRRLELAGVHRQYSGADDFRDERRRVKREAKKERGEFGR